VITLVLIIIGTARWSNIWRRRLSACGARESNW